MAFNSDLEIYNTLWPFPLETSPHTRKAILKYTRRILQMAVDQQELPLNPCAGVTVKVQINDQDVLNRSEVDRLLKEGKITNHPFYPVWVTALKTGMRSGELVALLWSDVDFESKIIHVSKSWSSKNGLKSTKNERKRVVPLSDDLAIFLKELRLTALPNRLSD